jgi:hypothetical protein
VIGAELPSAGVTYYEVPAEYGVKDYRYTVVNDRTVLVDPRTHRIVKASSNRSRRFRRVLIGKGPALAPGFFRALAKLAEKKMVSLIVLTRGSKSGVLIRAFRCGCSMHSIWSGF